MFPLQKSLGRFPFVSVDEDDGVDVRLIASRPKSCFLSRLVVSPSTFQPGELMRRISSAAGVPDESGRLLDDGYSAAFVHFAYSW